MALADRRRRVLCSIPRTSGGRPVGHRRNPNQLGEVRGKEHWLAGEDRGMSKGGMTDYGLPVPPDRAIVVVRSANKTRGGTGRPPSSSALFHSTAGWHWQAAVIECSVPSHGGVALAGRRHRVLCSIPRTSGGRPVVIAVIQTNWVKYEGKSTGWPVIDRGMSREDGLTTACHRRRKDGQTACDPVRIVAI